MLESARQARESSIAQRAVGEDAAAGTGTHGAASSDDNHASPSLQESLPVLPRVRPHWQALGELPAARVATFAAWLDQRLVARQEQLRTVISEHGWPAELYDAQNVLCGVRGVSYSMGQNDAAGQWLFDGSTHGSLADAMRAVKSAAQCEATNCYEDGDEVDT